MNLWRFFIFGFFIQQLSAEEFCCCPSLVNSENCAVSTEVKAEFLYWKFYESLRNFLNTGLGVTNSVPARVVSVDRSGTRYTADFDFTPGARASFDFRFGLNKAYDLKAQYTWYHTVGKQSVNQSDLVGSMNGVAWFLAVGGTNNPISSSNIRTELTFQWIDLEAGYQFERRHFCIRPFTGLTSYLNYGDLQVQYNFLELATTSLFRNQNIEETFMAHEFFLGIGMLNGFDCSWNIAKNWNLLGRFDVKMLYFREYAHSKERFQSLDTGTQIYLIRGKNTFDRACFFYEFNLGPSWDIRFNKNRHHLSLRAGWDWIISSGGMMGFFGRQNIELPYFFHLQGLNISSLFEF